jgi:hypothetical protein
MKFLKITAIVLVSLWALGGVAFYFGIKWVNKNLESLINSDPERAYNINFQTVDFNYFTRVIFISGVKITPVGPQKGVFVEGEVEQVELNKLDLVSLFLNKELALKELVFFKPEFVIYVPVENPDQEKAGEGLKNLFGDILSRGKIENFKLGQAEVRMMQNGEQTGNLRNFNVLATELSTDSLKVNYPIPFDYGRILISIDSVGHRFTNGHILKTGKIEFDTQSQELKIIAPSLKYAEGRREASTRREFQVDVVEMELDSMVFSGLEATSNLYSDLDIRAVKLEVSGLILDDFRNKHIPRPPDEVKPLFQGLVKKISFPLKLDTLRLINGAISYGELVPDKDEDWKFQLDHINGDLINVTSIPEYQARVGHVDANFTAKIDGAGSMTIDIDVPYVRDEFELKVGLTDFPLAKINEILGPLMNGRIETGDLVKLELEMHADSMKSVNRFRFDYTDLKMEIFRKGSQKKNRLMSVITNIMLNQSNLPGEKKYITSAHTTDRHRYRGPFHLIWKSTKEGILQIVPGNAAKELINTEEK